MVQDVQITNLEPITPPEPVAFWPPQPGWYVVLVLLLILFGYGLYRYTQYKKRNAYRKRALQELEKLSAKTFERGMISDLNTLLKVTALKGYPRNMVAELTGAEWLDFLESTEPKLKFSERPGILLATASYEPPGEIEVDINDWNNLIHMSKTWIKSHKHF